MEHEIKTDPSTRPEAVKATPQARRALASGTLGSALEWFDFSIYGALSATIFPQLFFGDMSSSNAALAAFATFGVGFVARPLGGVVFGYLGDKIGRRSVLMVTLVMMGVASLIIGLLPTAAAIGFLAPLILVLMRFIQGFSLGGEATGAQLMTMEHAPKDRRAFYAAMMTMGSPISQVLANLSLAGLSFALSPEDFLAWGWRLPFILNIGILIIGIYIRFRVEETPIYREGAAAGNVAIHPLAVLKNHGLTILRLMLSYAPFAITFYFIIIFGISYMTNTLNYGTSETFTIIMIANLVSILAIWAGGRTADRIGRRPVFLIGCTVCLVAALLFFPIVGLGSFPLTLLITTVATSAVQFANATQGAMFAEAFPTQVRYSGSALAFTGANLVFSAPAPFVATWLLSLGHGPSPITAVWVVLIVIGLIMIFLGKEGKSLEGAAQSFGRSSKSVQ